MRGECRPSQMVDLLEDLLGSSVQQSTFIFKFAEAFPEIPLRRLIDASGWSRFGEGGFDYVEFDRMLAPWLPLPGTS